MSYTKTVFELLADRLLEQFPDPQTTLHYGQDEIGDVNFVIERAATLLARGCIRAESGRLEEAIEDFKEARDIDGKKTSLYCSSMGALYERLGHKEFAKSMYRTVVFSVLSLPPTDRSENQLLYLYSAFRHLGMLGERSPRDARGIVEIVEYERLKHS